ncbi:hypothetical protein HDU86_001751 [Geranomyces michiganensis]|nr:hypothetical protein HDU86_001751 [Geranomyces michiganensis]
MLPADKGLALGLYRRLLRTAHKLPTPERRDTVVRRIRDEFRHARDAPTSLGPEAEGSAKWHLALGHVQLENLERQVEHLVGLPKEQLIIPVDIYAVDRRHWGKWADNFPRRGGGGGGGFRQSRKRAPPAEVDP